ncbi:GNAT family N-acetyltransferase [Acidobacteria bacterium AH-259-O06]|nr:GNAT family N-acetyltransferase [Acidobacteria bacterium AH-259-O06]
MQKIHLRTMTSEDRYEVAELIYSSINVWYQNHGRSPIFKGGPRVTQVFYDVYSALEPGCAVVAENIATDRLMGSCFYHPRKHHVSLGIMNVHPNYFAQGVGKALLKYIMDYTERNGYKALRLTQSAINVDSFSLYNAAGFVPRCAYQDMLIQVPEDGMNRTAAGIDDVREAGLEDVPAMGSLEMEVSGITREEDYRYCIENELGFWHVSVYENPGGDIDGFMISSAHPALNMLGPCVARSEKEAAALVLYELNQHKGRSPVFLIPMEREKLVRQMYQWGARNCELHFCQVRGEFKPFNGISMPTFLPETG